MKSSEHYIKQLESTNSRLEKEAIIQEAVDNNEKYFFQGLRFALDSLTTFGIKQIPEKTNTNTSANNLIEWYDFVFLLEKLSERIYTGNVAISEIHKFMESCEKDRWNYWYRRIIQKDLKCGISEKTINKILKKNGKEHWMIPTFNCMLATDGSKMDLSGEYLVETKLDGVRVLTIVYPDGRVNQFSRNGKEFHNFGHIKEQFKKIAHRLNGPTVFDGEVMSASFQDLMKQVFRKDNIQADDSILYIFDWFSLNDFLNNQCNFIQRIRSKSLHNWFLGKQHNLPNVRVLDQEIVDFSTKEGKQKFAELNKIALKGGYEGLMLKDPNSVYETKRTKSWLKIKPFYTYDLKVIGFAEGTGKYKGKLGALICSGKNEEGTEKEQYIETNVGSGFSDKMREDIWNNKQQIIDQIVEVGADAITKNQNGFYSLRFPRFMRFRGFNIDEKL
jgi:DNA ligase-1